MVAIAKHTLMKKLVLIFTDGIYYVNSFTQSAPAGTSTMGIKLNGEGITLDSSRTFI